MTERRHRGAPMNVTEPMSILLGALGDGLIYSEGNDFAQLCKSVLGAFCITNPDDEGCACLVEALMTLAAYPSWTGREAYARAFYRSARNTDQECPER